MDYRIPIVSGMFYKDEFQALDKQIKSCFEHKLGPGSLPSKRTTKVIKGIISPHAGYSYSGPCAAWAYKEIAESAMCDVYILIGPNHTGQGSDSVSLQNWATPFGMVKTHNVFAEDLIRLTGISSDSLSHKAEHSIEVQLPFLQFACKDYLEKLKIVAISLKSDEKINILAKAINTIATKRNIRICLIASSDFTHFGPNYGYVPFKFDVKDSIYNIDGVAIEKIQSLKKDDFLKYVKSNQMTICGFYPLALLMETLNGYSQKSRILRYYTSGDLQNDYTNTVSYASILFE